MKNQELTFKYKPAHKKGRPKIVFIVGTGSGCYLCRNKTLNNWSTFMCENNRVCIQASRYFDNVFKDIKSRISICPKILFKG